MSTVITPDAKQGYAATIIAYDMDGVLAEGPAPSEKKWGLMKGPEREQRRMTLLQHYGRAKMLFFPPEPRFYVITARKNDPETALQTSLWLDRHFGDRVVGLYMLPVARTLENVIGFKSRTLVRLLAKEPSGTVLEFTEDNLKILKGVRKSLPDCRLFHFVDGTKKPL